MVEFEIISMVTGQGAEMFNRFFTLVSVFGLASLAVGVLVSMIRGS